MNIFKKHFGGAKEILYLLSLKRIQNKTKKAIGDEVELYDLTHIQFRAWTAFIISKILKTRRVAAGFTADESLIWNDNKNGIRSFVRKISPLRYLIGRLFQMVVHIGKVESNSSIIRPKIEFQTKWDLINYEINGLNIGDLIYDTYLKRFRKPTVNLRDARLYELVEEANVLYERFSKLIDSLSIKSIYVTHTSYIFYGILARVGLKNGIKVFLFGNSRTGDSRELQIDDWNQLPRVDGKLKLFDGLCESEKIKYIEAAKAMLKNRLSGQIDPLISYMKVNPYLNVASKKSEIVLSKVLIVYLHDFFDSPHVYGEIIFPDFYEWIAFVLNWANTNNVRVILKRHPNAMSGNDDVLAEFVDSWCNVEVISSGDAISLTKEYPNALFLSVYGTCTQEIAFNSGRILLAGASPYMKSTMAITATDVESYENYLSTWLHGDLIIKSSPNEPYYTIAAYFLAGDSRKYPGSLNNTDLFEII